MPRLKATKKKAKAPGKRGPKMEFLKLNGNWKDAIQRSFQKEKPKEGWPKD